MKRNLLITLSICMALIAININAQVRPDDINHEIHLYDFEDGSADDLIGSAHGLLNDNATIHSGILDLTSTAPPGGSLTLPADIIEINTYPELTIDTWATPSTNVNSPNAVMMWAFGTYGSLGYNYLFFTPARWGINAAARLSNGTWDSEDGISVDWNIGDSTLHHYILTIDMNRVMTLYVDGGDSLRLDTLDAEHPLDSIANDTVLIGKSVYSTDSTWKGTVELFAIWDIALTADEVKWLYEQGPDRGMPVGIYDIKQPLTSLDFYVSNNRLFVKNLSDANNLSVIIYDITGVMVYQNNDFQNGEYLKLNPGVYIVKSQHLDIGYVQKIIIR
jgi:hypothetical protein